MRADNLKKQPELWRKLTTRTALYRKMFIESVVALGLLPFHQQKLWQKKHIIIVFLSWNPVLMSALVSQLVAQFLKFGNHVVHSCHLISYLTVNLITCYIYKKLLRDKKKYIILKYTYSFSVSAQRQNTENSSSLSCLSYFSYLWWYFSL